MLTNYFEYVNLKTQKGITMIKKLLETIKMANLKRKINKPCYPIYKLITGKIVYLHKRTRYDKETEYTFRKVKNLDIVEKSTEKDYAIMDWEMFEDQPNMKMYMRKHHLTEESLLSFAQIYALEELMNKDNVYHNENDKVFC